MAVPRTKKALTNGNAESSELVERSFAALAMTRGTEDASAAVAEAKGRPIVILRV